MKVTLKRINDAVLFEGTNEAGNKVKLDGSASIGGEGNHLSPMEMLLVSLASCSCIDVVIFLKKMKQILQDLEVTIKSERRKDIQPAIFEKIHLHYFLSGDLKISKVEKALSLSVEKYCSVAKMIENTAEITYSYEIKGETGEE